jgi:hypothetical protein
MGLPTQGPVGTASNSFRWGYTLVECGTEYEKTFGIGVAGVQRLGLVVIVGY